jgi:hypothetical protein
VTVEHKDIDDRDNDRVNDRDDREKRNREDKDNSLNTRNIGNQDPPKRDKDRDEEAKDQNRIVRIPYRQLLNVQKNIIQYCSIPRTAKVIMDYIDWKVRN